MIHLFDKSSRLRKLVGLEAGQIKIHPPEFFQMDGFLY